MGRSVGPRACGSRVVWAGASRFHVAAAARAGGPLAAPLGAAQRAAGRRAEHGSHLALSAARGARRPARPQRAAVSARHRRCRRGGQPRPDLERRVACPARAARAMYAPRVPCTHRAYIARAASAWESSGERATHAAPRDSHLRARTSRSNTRCVAYARKQNTNEYARVRSPGEY